MHCVELNVDQRPSSNVIFKQATIHSNPPTDTNACFPLTNDSKKAPEKAWFPSRSIAVRSNPNNNNQSKMDWSHKLVGDFLERGSVSSDVQVYILFRAIKFRGKIWESKFGESVYIVHKKYDVNLTVQKHANYMYINFCSYSKARSLK